MTASPQPKRDSVAPAVTRESGRGDMALLRWFLGMLGPHRWSLSLAMLCLVLASLAELTQPYLVKLAIDGPIAERQPEALWPLAALFVVLVILRGVFAYAQTILSTLVGQRVVDQMRCRLFGHVVSMPSAYYDRTPVGAVLTRVINDTEALNEAIASGVVNSLGSVVVLLGAVGGMFLVAGRWALLGLAAVPLLLLALAFIRRVLRVTFEVIRALSSQINQFLEERLSGMAVVQSFAAEPRTLDEFDLRNEGKLSVELRSVFWQSMLSAVIQLASMLSVAGLLVAAGWGAGGSDGAASAISLGALVALVDYVQRFYQPFEDLSGKYAILQRAFVSLDKMAALLDRDERLPLAAAPKSVAPLEKEIRFEDVRFVYREGKEVLHGVSLCLRKGETLAVVGATGAGKTTLARLLGRFYDVTSGKVTWDGQDVRDLDPASLRSRLAFVPQDVFLFSRSLRENVMLQADDGEPGRLQGALDQALANGVVDAMPEGLETEVHERGQDLSAGERQLLALARAFYQDPSVLVLDEATSHVDLETEARVREAMRRVSRGRTTLLIAHRLATAREADRIAVMVGGGIAEEGTHEALMERNGTYAELWRAAMDG